MHYSFKSVSLQGEIKLSVTIEDEANKDLPSAVQLFRPIRQYVYGVLFSLAETRKKAERLAARKNCLPECELWGHKALFLPCHFFDHGRESVVANHILLVMVERIWFFRLHLYESVLSLRCIDISKFQPDVDINPVFE